MIRFLLHDFGQFNATRRIGPNQWDHFDLLWLYAGRVKIWLNSHPPIELQGGDSLLIYPGTKFHGHAVTPTAFASVQHFSILKPAALSISLRRLKSRKKGYTTYRGFADNPVISDIERAISMHTLLQTAAVQELRQLNLAMIINQLEAKPAANLARPNPSLLMAWRKEFRLKPPRKATVSELTLRLRIPLVQLRAVLAQSSLTPRRFLLDMRMEHTRRILSDNRIPIKAVAHEVGYSDVVAFHRAFISYFSEAPAAYRRRHHRQFTG